MDLRGRDALSKKIDPGVLLGDEEQIRDGVGQEAVDFFRHRPVEAAKPRLDVDEGEAELTAVMAAARVEFTSPTTRTRSGRTEVSSGSRRCMTCAVWMAWEPDPTPRLWSGA